MMLSLNRVTSDAESTIGLLYIDGLLHSFTLEDEFRFEKVVDETRIPAGRYRVGLRMVGGFHGRYRKYSVERWGKPIGWHRGMLQLLNVPGFEYVLFHIGNTDKDTSGCICPGFGAKIKPNDMSVSESTDAYCQLYEKVLPCAEIGDLEIVVRDEYP